MSLSVWDFTIIVEYKGDDSAILFYCDYSNIDYYYSENSIVCRMHGLIVCFMHHLSIDFLLFIIPTPYYHSAQYTL